MPSPLQIPNTPVAPPIVDEDPTNQAPDVIDPTAPKTNGSLSGIASAMPTDIDPTKDTVEGRVEGIVSKGGPLQQLAETRSKQQSSKRGLLNTSMAVGAGQKALYESALPIAQSDAQYAQSINLQREKEAIDKRILTASADEQLRLIAKKGEIDAQLQTDLQSTQGAQALEQIAARGGVEADLVTRRGDIEKELQTADSATRSRLLQEQATIDTELTNLRGQLEADLVTRRGDIEKELQTADAETRSRLVQEQAAIETELTNLRGGIESELVTQRGGIESELAAQRGGIEADLLDRRGEIDKALQSADAETRSRLLQEQGVIDFDLVKARGEEEQAIRAQQAAIDTELTTLSAGFKSADIAAQQLHETQLNNDRMALEERLQELDGEQRITLQKLQGDQAIELEDIRGYYDGQISTQKSAAVLYQTTQQMIAEMLMNPDLTAQNRQTAIQYQLDNLEASLGVLGAMGGVDISSILGVASTIPTAAISPDPGAPAQPVGVAAPAQPVTGTPPPPPLINVSPGGASIGPNNPDIYSPAYQGPTAGGSNTSTRTWQQR